MMRKKMQKASPIKTQKREPSIIRIRLGQVGLVISAMFGLYLLLSLLTYDPTDPGFPQTAAWIQNDGGIVGAWLAHLLFSLAGWAAYIAPFSLFYHASIHWQELRDRSQNSRLLSTLRLLGWICILISLSGLITLFDHTLSSHYPDGPGGLMGLVAPKFFLPLLNFDGSVLSLIALLLIGLTLFSGKLWFKHSLLLLRFLSRSLSRFFQHFCAMYRAQKNQGKAPPLPIMPEEIDPPFETKPPLKPKEENKILSPAAPIKIIPRPSGSPPTIDLLDPPQESNTKMSKEQLTQTARLVEQKLGDFGIMATVMGTLQGPVVTRYEIQLAAGVKVAKLTTIEKDLARSLSVPSVRVVEVIPGKTFVGLELPNPKREMVRLKEVLDSDAFRNSKSPICMGLGKDISGSPEVVDLARMPHLLVAGTTGSGKSVGLNAMLLSMLLKSPPEKLRLILIDPKMLELSIYEGIPHLLTPVVTDMKEAANALRWCVKEMDRRYRLMSALGVRNLDSFNELVQTANDKNKAIPDPVWLQLNPGRSSDCPPLTPLPYIVVLIDEFADMMIVVGKKVEELITRIAQKARAAGIHLIVATQRPSVDVITGLIKANIPTRIAFQVSSKIDSRTILDQQGAEQLLGNGDMLYLPAGSGVPIRVHGAYVSDQEVHHVVEAWRACAAPNYVDSILATEKLEGEDGEEGESIPSGEADPLYDEAVQIILESKRASISLVQRRLRIGYNRAARLLEDMEKAGMVSAIQPNGLREVLGT